MTLGTSGLDRGSTIRRARSSRPLPASGAAWPTLTEGGGGGRAGQWGQRRVVEVHGDPVHRRAEHLGGDLRQRRRLPAADVGPDWEARTGQAGYFHVPVVIAGRYRGLAFQADEPGEPGYPRDQIELFSEVRLRDALGLEDGDHLAVTTLPG